MLEHHVILCKYGEDCYIDKILQKSNYPDEKGRLEQCVVITGSLTGERITLTKDGVAEMIKILGDIKL